MLYCSFVSAYRIDHIEHIISFIPYRSMGAALAVSGGSTVVTSQVSMVCVAERGLEGFLEAFAKAARGGTTIYDT